MLNGSRCFRPIAPPRILGRRHRLCQRRRGREVAPPVGCDGVAPVALVLVACGQPECLSEAPTPPQQKTGNPQQCRRHKALIRHTEASCFPSAIASGASFLRLISSQQSFPQTRDYLGRTGRGSKFEVETLHSIPRERNENVRLPNGPIRPDFGWTNKFQ